MLGMAMADKHTEAFNMHCKILDGSSSLLVRLSLVSVAFDLQVSAR